MIGLTDEANVDEVFIDLCRQIIRKRKIEGLGAEDDLEYEYENSPSHARSRERRRYGRGRRRRRESRCPIL